MADFSEIRKSLRDFVDGSGDSRFPTLVASLGNGNNGAAFPIWPTLGAVAREEAFRASVALRRINGLDGMQFPRGLFWLNGYKRVREYSIDYPARIMAEGWQAEVYLQMALVLMRIRDSSIESKTQILPDLFSMASTHYDTAGALAHRLDLPEANGLTALALQTKSWADAGYRLRENPEDLSVLQGLKHFAPIQTPNYIVEVNKSWEDKINFCYWTLICVAQAYLTTATMIEEWDSSQHALISQLSLAAYQLARWVYQDTHNQLFLMGREARELMAYAQSMILAHDVYQNSDVAGLVLDPTLPTQILVDYKGTLDAPQRAHALFDKLDASNAAQGYYLFGTFPWEWHNPSAWGHDAEKLANISEARRTSGEDWAQLQVRHPKLRGDLTGGKYPMTKEIPQTHFARHVATLQAAGLNPGTSNVIVLDDQGDVLKRAVAADEYPESHRGFMQVVQLTSAGNPGTPSSVEKDWEEVERKIKLSQTGVYQKVPPRFDWPDAYDPSWIEYLNPDKKWWMTLLDDAPNAHEIRAGEDYALLFKNGASIRDYFDNGAESCTPEYEEEILDVAGEDPILLACLITLYGLIDAATYDEISVADLYAMLEPHFEELGIDSASHEIYSAGMARFQRAHGLTRTTARLLEMV
ncbi:MAG: hypothetical protein A3G32_05100 [Deltaproteobacteria bacterium RIFCSPLOWO2_12_FULL_40_28]|nr:MAG: hypothetical protein A3C45_09210 [Deltaproteobacteria bacterium RIFCSPHIGHO2_02_FULL_40_28]OGQ19739.1 MAG: hypothetical protein A3E27_08405 [Deltaproteobacteria bacterium RIFCSPHIGHO2_12_FULL_40_32]OGQ41016.1 MAG: hypothetical protein A3I69_03820 [Deltaproteobacteria bacterium RIFCSPLOWO2_02_FULL_40_36]OGQ54132.1 MAG: hypothetical protein A3G32_05100 [Deltaproteobacteria bacterium RIFCSPLOWO2_12_FULL_40_28]